MTLALVKKQSVLMDYDTEVEYLSVNVLVDEMHDR